MISGWICVFSLLISDCREPSSYSSTLPITLFKPWQALLVISKIFMGRKGADWITGLLIMLNEALLRWDESCETCQWVGPQLPIWKCFYILFTLQYKKKTTICLLVLSCDVIDFPMLCQYQCHKMWCIKWRRINCNFCDIVYLIGAYTHLWWRSQKSIAYYYKWN